MNEAPSLPEWATLALDTWMRPHCGEVPERHAALDLIRERVAAAIGALGEVFEAFRRNAEKAGVAYSGGLGGANWEVRLPALMLECVAWEVFDSELSKDLSEIRLAARRLDTVNAQIASLADGLTTLLRERSELCEAHGLDDSAPDDMPRLRLWHLIEEAADDYGLWRSIMESHGHWRSFLNTARGQSRPGPNLSDLVALVGKQQFGPASAQDAGDAATLAGGALRGLAPVCGRMLVRIDEKAWSSVAGDRMAPLEWLTDRGFATLAATVLGKSTAPQKGGDPLINVERVRKWRGRYLARQTSGQLPVKSRRKLSGLA